MKNGFSLVEMMVAVSLVALMASIGFANMLRSNEQKRVTEAAETIRQAYTQAKAYALAGRKDCTACGATGGVCGKGTTEVQLEGWVSNLNSATPSIEIHGECGTSPAISFFSSGTKTFPTRISVTTAGGNSAVKFRPLNGGIELNNTLTITVTSTLSSIRSKRFTVSQNGEISAIITL